MDGWKEDDSEKWEVRMEWDGYIRYYNNEKDDMLMNGNDSEGNKEVKVEVNKKLIKS
jgi:hypothetical protein